MPDSTATGFEAAGRKRASLSLVVALMALMALVELVVLVELVKLVVLVVLVVLVILMVLVELVVLVVLVELVVLVVLVAVSLTEGPLDWQVTGWMLTCSRRFVCQKRVGIQGCTTRGCS